MALALHRLRPLHPKKLQGNVAWRTGDDLKTRRSLRKWTTEDVTGEEKAYQRNDGT